MHTPMHAPSLPILASLAIAASLAAADTPLTTADITSTLTHLDTAQPWSLTKAAGSFLAVHFVARVPDASSRAAWVTSFAAGGERLAGLTQVFATPDAAWASELGDWKAMVFLDRAGALEAEVARGADAPPATIVFDPTGRELFRLPASSTPPSFATFEPQFIKATQTAAINDYNLPKGSRLAIDGYDPVAYVVSNRAEKGKPAITSTYMGVTYQFATQDHRRRFNADPARYLPSYGGWCAYAMGNSGEKVEIDPTSFKVKDGRVHLFYKDFFTNTLKLWNAREPQLEPAADASWAKIVGQTPPSTPPNSPR